MKIPFVDLRKQYDLIKDEIDNAIQNVIKDSAFIGGKYVKTFEQNYANYIGVKHCIGVGNGTDALFIALWGLGIHEGDEVITAANSFIATSEAITMTGAKVVFVDCDKETYNIDVKKIERAITNRTKAIIPIHLYGQPADIDQIIEFAQKSNIYIIEDAAQAHGAQYKGRNVGILADCACFSFFPAKNLGAYGDAGTIVTNNDELATKVRMYANHGRIEKYNHEIEGVNSRLDGLQAAILDVKLKYLEKWNKRRRTIAKMYDEGLKGVVETPKVLPYVKHVYHLYVIRVKNRDKVREFLANKGISTGIHYPIPLPRLKAYNYLGHKPIDFPVAYSLKDEILSLPIHGDMSDEQVDYVIEQVINVVNKESVKRYGTGKDKVCPNRLWGNSQ
ncbi:MAG: DegT/DnrJ/EryC1/StrS family aminotransferase [Nitrospirota bacterium]